MIKNYLNTKKALLSLVALSVYLLIITPLLIINLRQQQEFRGKAAGGTPTPVQMQAGAYCGNVPADIMLIIDRSSSMTGSKITEVKQAAKSFIDVVAKDTNNRIGLVSFSSTAVLDSGLSNNFTNIKNKIDGLNANGYTCHECAITKANQEISTNGRSGVKKVIIILTDGLANYLIGGSGMVNTSVAEQKALDAVKSGFATSKTAFFTIGFGTEGKPDKEGYNGKWLKNIAALTGGKYYYPAPGELEAVYQEISLLIGKGLLSGFVFNDLNKNGVFDQDEPLLTGWTIQLISSTGTKNYITDSTGYFTITGICDGNYQLKEIAQEGWMQTTPSDPNGYTITISNGNSFTDKNFGNVVAPTATPTLTPTPTPKPRCSDDKDNDNNGFTDSKDSSCHTDGNPNNQNSYDPGKNGELGGGNTCADSIDNNNNGVTDGGDPVCHTDGNANNPASYDPNLPEVNPPTPTNKPTPTLTPTNTPTPIPPTATPNPTPAHTFLALTVYQHGIWNSGDNTNPTQTSMSNKNPQHTTIDAELELFNDANQLYGQGLGPIHYSSESGNFKGVIGIYPDSFPTGKYYLKVKTKSHLKKQVAGILNIKSGEVNFIPSVTLVAGDANNDNQISIIDYNMLLDCYSDLAHAVACNGDKKVATDFNDDNFVNQVDYNLFLREIATQPGQ